MRDPMNSNGVSIYKVDTEEVDGRSNTELTDLINNAKIHVLERPNLVALRKKRLERDNAAMKVISPSIAEHVLGKSPQANSCEKKESAAICIQRYFRGHMGRKEYVHLLYKQFEKDEAERQNKIEKQVEEGLVIVDNYHLTIEMDENDCIRRNQHRRENCSAMTIQRVWREYTKRMHAKLAQLNEENENLSWRNNEDSKFSDLSSVESTSMAKCHEEVLIKKEDVHQSDGESEQESSDVELYIKSTLSTSVTSDNSESVDLNKELPPSSTDWESIDHCLNSNGLDNSDSQYTPDPKVINRLSIGPDYLQLCFEDDNVLSDEDRTDHEDAEIKEYVIEDNPWDQSCDSKKRDSGCVMKDDELCLEPLDVKIIKPEELEGTQITDEETNRVLTQLKSVTETEMDIEKADIFRKKLERFSVRHLETQIRDLKLKIKDVSDQLVRELLIRDQLHTKQDALLMDVEDAVKYAQTSHDMLKKKSK